MTGGVLLRLLDGRPQSVISIDVLDGRIQAVHRVVDPDKLRHLA